jgi:DNA primase
MPPDFFEASMLPDETKEQLCRELLAEFGVAHVNRTHKGELIHSCSLPFGRHKNGDRSPSASLNYKKLTYKCLGCGSGGGLLWYIASCRGEDGAQARTWLEAQAGLGQTVMELATLLKMLDAMYAQGGEQKPVIPRYADSMLDPWTWPVHHPYLTDGDPESGLKGRGIPEATLEHFRVGYAPEYFMGRDAVPSHTERLVFPHFWNGDLVGWQARRLNPADEPKYKNSPDFPKDQTIFNYENGDRTRAILVEAPVSVLRHFHHQPTLQATFGASTTDEQIRLLQRYDDVVLWFDNDDAGWKATRQVGESLARYNTVWVVDSPYSADPADIDDDEEVARLVSDAIPYVIWNPPKKLIPWRQE